MTPDQYCQEKAVQSGSSFYYSFLFLPPEKRRAITALYAFCREVDDIVDECTEESVARTKLAWWRQEIASVYSAEKGKEARHPVSKALVEVIKKTNLSADMLNEIIDGMEMDLDYKRYADFTTLKHYCHHVAGVVGQLSAEIFGYHDHKTLEYAHKLGLAFQLTNIIRDVGEDARRDRIYLPEDELAQFNVSSEDIMQLRESDGFRQLMEFQIERAENYYIEAFATLPAEDRKSQRPGFIMAAIYRALLEEIKEDSCQVMHQRISLTPIRKLWIGWRTWIKG